MKCQLSKNYWVIFILGISLGACATSADSHFPASSPPIHTDVFLAETDGYPNYRIPSLVTSQKGTLLAFCEGRNQRSDHAANDLVLRRSLDQGKSWEPLQVIAEAGDDCLSNPQAVVLQATGRILLVFQQYPEGIHEREVIPGYEGDSICRSFIMYSDDNGKTWAPRREITQSVKPPTATSTASGPGIGIQLTHSPYKGRILMPFNQGPFGDWKVYAAYSDDGGASWQYGETAPAGAPGHGNEVQMVELADGAVMLNARSHGGEAHRKTAISQDGGETWSPLRDDHTLIDPQCMGTILRYKEKVLLFANPMSRDERMNGGIRVSLDDGHSWSEGRTIYPKSFAYSCLAKLPDGSIGLLYEANDYGKIAFARFGMNWAMGK